MRGPIQAILLGLLLGSAFALGMEIVGQAGFPVMFVTMSDLEGGWLRRFYPEG